MNGDLSRLQREVILLSLRSWTRPRRAASQDTESDTPECEPADRLVMTTSASELKSRDECPRGSAKVVEGVLHASFATDKTSGTEWSRIRGFEGALRRAGVLRLPGRKASPFNIQVSGKVTEGAIRSRRGATATGAYT